MLQARSNVCVVNHTGYSLQVKALAASSQSVPPVLMEVNNMESRSVPLMVAMDTDLTICLLDRSSNTWCEGFLFNNLLKSKHNRLLVGNMIAYIESTMHYDEFNQTTVYDHAVEIVTGVRVINCLPYSMEVKHTSANDTLMPQLHRLGVGEEMLFPFDIASASGRLNMRILGGSILNLDTWSPDMDLNELFNIPSNTATGVVLLPASFSSDPCCVSISITKDPCREDRVMGQYPSTPTLTVFADSWIVNNSGITLEYKAKCSSDRVLLGDTHRGVYEFTASPMVKGTPHPKFGPVILPPNVSSFKVRVAPAQFALDELVCLQKFQSIDMYCPDFTKNREWSRSVVCNLSTTGEICVGDLRFGITVHVGSGNFSITRIITITPRYILRNLTTRVFPVQLYHRLRVISKDVESESVRIFADDMIKSMHKDPFLSLDGPNSAEKVSFNAPNGLTTLSHDDTMSPTSDIMRQSSDICDDDIGWDRAETLLIKKKINTLQGKRNITRLSQRYSVEDMEASLQEALHQGQITPRWKWKKYRCGPSTDIGTSTSLRQISLDTFHEDVLSDAVGTGKVERSTLMTIPQKHSCAFYEFIEFQKDKSLKKLTHSTFTGLLLREAQKSMSAETAAFNCLVVHIASACNLAKADMFGKSDPFCRLYWQGELIYSTSVIRENLNPSWDETFFIPLYGEDMLNCSLDLRIEVM